MKQNKGKRSSGRDKNQRYPNRDRSFENERSSGRERPSQSDEKETSRQEQPGLVVCGRNTVVSYLERMAAAEDEEVQQIVKIFLAEGNAQDERVRTIEYLARKLGVPLVTCHNAKLDFMVAEGGRHQGVVAQISPVKLLDFQEWLGRLDADRSKFEQEGTGLNGYVIVALDGIEDPRNVGAIIRSAEAQGAKAVFIPERRAASVTETVAKTSAGAIAHIPIVQVTNLVPCFEALKERGFWIMGLSAEANESIYMIDLIRPLVIVVGSEGKGLRPLVRDRCDFLGSIPLAGKTSSLNASVALGIAVYETLRQSACSKS